MTDDAAAAEAAAVESEELHSETYVRTTKCCCEQDIRVLQVTLMISVTKSVIRENNFQ